MGLTQSALASLSGLSRQTVNQLENGNVQDLSLGRADRLAGVLGLSLQVGGNVPGPVPTGRMSPLERAAKSIQVSYKTPMPVSELEAVLLSGQVSPSHAPHVHALLDEAPVSLLASLVDQLHREHSMDKTRIWANFRKLAHDLKIRRGIWR